MNEPHLVLPLDDGISADRAVFRYVRDRVDNKVKFIEELTDASPDALWLLTQIIRTYLVLGQAIVIHQDGSYRLMDSASPDPTSPVTEARKGADATTAATEPVRRPGPPPPQEAPK